MHEKNIYEKFMQEPGKKKSRLIQGIGTCTEVAKELTRRTGGLVVEGSCPNGPPRYPAPKSSLLDGYIESVSRYFDSGSHGHIDSLKKKRKDELRHRQHGSGWKQRSRIRHSSCFFLFFYDREQIEGSRCRFHQKQDGWMHRRFVLPRRRK